MDSTLQEQFKYYEFTTGRRIVCMRKVKNIAEDMGDLHIARRTEVVLAQDRVTRVLDMAWRESQYGAGPVSALRPMDDLVDSSVTGIRDGAAALTKGARPDDPVANLAHKFLDAAFPVGVALITNLPCVEELAAIEVLLDRLHGELAPMVHKLGLTVHVERLAALVPEYREVIEATREKLEFHTVDTARKRSHALMLEVVSLIVGTYYLSDDPTHVSARAALLAPILEQQAVMASMFRARRAVRDIDPDIEGPDTEQDTGLAEVGSGAALLIPESASNPAIPTA